MVNKYLLFFSYFSRPHPHNLVGKEAKHGVLTHKFNTESIVTFNFLGIQCVRKIEVDESLEKREHLKIDPFRSKYFFFIFNNTILCVSKNNTIFFHITFYSWLHSSKKSKNNRFKCCSFMFSSIFNKC